MVRCIERWVERQTERHIVNKAYIYLSIQDVLTTQFEFSKKKIKKIEFKENQGQKVREEKERECEKRNEKKKIEREIKKE